MSSDIRKHSSQRVDNEIVVVLKKVNSILTTSKIFLEIVHASHTSSWSNQFDKCSESITRQKSIKKKTKFNIIWLKMYISGLVTTLFYKSFDFTYNTVILDQKCHQICTFWARKWWFLAFFKLFCQMSTKTSGNAVRTLGQIIWWYFCTTILKILLSPLYSKQCMCRTASESLIYPVECKGRFQTHSDRIILGKVHIKQLFW